MPKDNAGKFHNSIQRAMAADKNRPAPKPKASGLGHMPAMGGGESEEGGHSIHPHGDGTFHSVSAEGERTEHPTAGHAAAHFLGKHGEEGKHAVVSHDGFEHTSHQVESGGEVEGPHVHPDAEALGEHLKQFFDEEAHEGMAPHSAEHGMATGRIKDVY